ncbi:hypothetical protein SAMN04244572_01530 [Azotobacter beijerinckii]|uniref:Uncharacterized protein n=1 Tax=Azotobacter beijerinckii TaxID=170623 RepID=A0A1H9DAU2_9GAMM|nr:hypothetical protein [Azotobacter beijerinckii]SEI74754.1 hypothetical protein SAMN04244572_01530 [Azotobacter beijerinckii]SEQ10595.1 hypothetical protein SAMN04244573_01031 [Azotobacter beijerinckii]
MELTPDQITTLIGVTLGTSFTCAACYLIGRAAGIRLGIQHGHSDGYHRAHGQFSADLHETTQRLNKAERLLAATQTELRRVQDLHRIERRNATQALGQLTTSALQMEPPGRPANDL